MYCTSNKHVSFQKVGERLSTLEERSAKFPSAGGCAQALTVHSCLLQLTVSTHGFTRSFHFCSRQQRKVRLSSRYHISAAAYFSLKQTNREELVIFFPSHSLTADDKGNPLRHKGFFFFLILNCLELALNFQQEHCRLEVHHF